MRRTAWILVAAVGCAASTWGLLGVAIDRTPEAAAGAANLRALAPWWIASAVGWLMLTMLWGAMRGDLGWRLRDAGAVLAVAAAARGAVVLLHEPALSDDVHRYVFDGRNLAAGVNPYTVAPADRADADPERWPGERAVVALVNNPELHTIYLPTSQWLFGACGVALGDRGAEPATAARVLRAAMALSDLAAVTAVLLLLRLRGAAAWWAALYAWHPLPIAEVAGAGHQDATGVLLLLAALLACAARPAGLVPRVIRWTVPLAGAVLVKPVAIVAAPFLLRGRSARAWGTSLAVGAVACSALALPLWLDDGGTAFRNLATTATRFSLKWAHFGSVYEPVLTAIEHRVPAWTNDEQERLARGLCTVILLAIAIAAVVWARDATRGLSTVFLAMVLLSPAAHPWYLLWALALLPLTRSRTVWIASLTLPWGYAVLGDTVAWTVPTWVMVAAYAPVYAVGLWSLKRRHTLPDRVD